MRRFLLLPTMIYLFTVEEITLALSWWWWYIEFVDGVSEDSRQNGAATMQELNALEKTLVAIAAVLFVLAIGAQSYRAGQKHPSAQEFLSVQAAVELATERQQTGYDKGFEACQEQF
jgi:hypothetical protein